MDPVTASFFAAGLGGLIGGTGRGTQSGSTTTSTRFDEDSIPLFMRMLGMSDAQSQRFRQEMGQLSDQRKRELQALLDRQTQAVEGIGRQEVANINQRFDSARGNVGQNLANRGLYNSTIAPGMQALVERERSRALGNEMDRQKQILASIFGSQAGAIDAVNVGNMANMATAAGTDLQMRGLLPQSIAQNRVGTNRSYTKSKEGLLSSLF